jgi:hypothetical protein
MKDMKEEMIGKGYKIVENFLDDRIRNTSDGSGTGMKVLHRLRVGSGIIRKEKRV